MKFLRIKTLKYIFSIILIISTLSNVNSLKHQTLSLFKIEKPLKNKETTTNSSKPSTENNKQGQKKENLITFTEPKPKCISNDKLEDEGIKAGKYLEKKKVRKNPLRESEIGFGLSGVFFDYLDPVFRKPISEEFKRIYKEAQKVKEPFDFENRLTFVDYYASERDVEKKFNLSELILINTTSTPKERKKREDVEKKLAEMWFQQKYPKDAATKIQDWSTAITPGQLEKIISSWHWEYEHITRDQDYATTLVKIYDFDADGKLNAEEFLQAAIDLTTNYENSRTRGCLNCFADFKEIVLNPIFDSADSICENGMISAEEIWFIFKYLDRTQGEGFDAKKDDYNMYKCERPLHGNVRTNAVNDFVLKMRNENIGELSRHEFFTGILYGFLNRQVKGNDIAEDGKYNEIDKRYVKKSNSNLGGSNSSFPSYCP